MGNVGKWSTKIEKISQWKIIKQHIQVHDRKNSFQ